MKRWLKPLLIGLGFVAFTAVVWFAGPLIGFGDARPFAALWVRLTLIGLLALAILAWAVIGFLRRRKGQQALEKALVEDTPEGDGAELAERMQAALATLKQSGNSKTYLYDLPWYVIIGPPGSGKTTALMNAEIKFPLAEQKRGAMSGFGGTRYCDWWFAEEAILIDTAGRYTTQDSDASGDSSSWDAFLQLLKRNRPKQPINGVILAFSLSDLMNASPEELASHAETVRARLGEIHETLKIDFPVYVMFTKADLIAGFREYFGSFSLSRRRRVWGTTFQTEDRKAHTHEQVGPEFDALVARLSDEVIDRLSEEHDAASRIAIFGLPGQMALLRENIVSFLGQVFEPTRYKTNAILRGFYFTSGTQEGTPIDQVLGAMGRSFGSEAMGGLMSGQGKSFFLHDLMTKVIFGEQGWVSYDRKAVRRSAGVRIAGMVALGLFALVLLGGWTMSFLTNRALVQSVDAALTDYETVAREDLQANEISDTDFLRVAGHLQMLRTMPTGYGDTDEGEGIAERFGLGQRKQLARSAELAYADGLERLLRPRLILRIEEQLQAFVLGNETMAIYETLKVYKLLGGAAPAPEDTLIQAWFRADWRDVMYPGVTQAPARDNLEAHLAAMLELDGDREIAVELNRDLIEQAERILARMSVADRAYSLIVATAEFSGIPDFTLLERAGPDARLVFETVDGSELDTLFVPALYTYEGFHEFFLDQLAEVAGKLDNEQWVLGEQAQAANIEQQLSRLGPQMLNRYRDDFVQAWEDMLSNLRLAPMSADGPAYVALGAAASPATSPLLRLTEAIVAETRLTADPTATSGGGLAVDSEVTDRAKEEFLNRTLNRTSGLKRIGLDLAIGSVKSQRRAGAAGSGGPPPLPGANIEAQFATYHTLLEGTAGNRPIDGLLGSLGAIQQSLSLAAGYNQAQAAAQLPALIGQLRTTASRLPPTLARMVEEAVTDFEGSAANSTIAQINQEMVNNVTRVCEDITANRYPFARTTTRQVPLSEFTQLFAPDGVLDRFFNTHLAAHADMGGRQWRWREDSPLAERLSPATLRQFERAAAIREAFFPGRSPTVNLEVTISQTAAHSRVRQALLEVNGQVITTRQRGNTPQTVSWPGTGGASAALQLLPDINNRPSVIRHQGPWAFLQLLRDGNPRQVGDVMQVSFVIGGRNISYDIRVNALSNPFNLSELTQFRCPAGL